MSTAAAGACIQGQRAEIAFGAINAITQGQRVARLWPPLFERYGLEKAVARRAVA